MRTIFTVRCVLNPWRLFYFIFVPFLSFFLSCSAVSSLFISDADEEELGLEFHTQLLADAANYPVFNDQGNLQRIAFKAYVDSIFQTVLLSVPSDEMPEYQRNFTFTIIDQDIQNAFAVPGGYIYIYTGIIRTMVDESELAGVLGHEIAHVTQHHYRRSAAKGAAISTILEAIAGKESGALTQFVLQTFGALAGGYVSRDHESESDDFGTNYLYRSQRHPRGIASYFSRQQDGFVPEAFSSHPDASERVQAVDEYIADNGLTQWTAPQYLYQARFQAATAILGP